MKRKETFIIFIGLALAVSSRGEVYVAPNGPGPAPFASWATAAPDIQSAVTAAAPDDTILISNGVYGGGGIRIRYDLGLRIENCTITGNSADKPGGGINFYAPTTLVNTIIYGNTCSYSSTYNNYYQRYDGTNAVFESSL
ncbi:MAG: hypothetical protein WC340_02375 [Kiritimatiellia bacterium]|jgi:hypothetical protein